MNVLLFYKYVEIEDHMTFAEDHLSFCRSLDLKGRILIASEGINGTVSGTIEQTDCYIEAMHQDRRFADMVFKVDSSDEQVFKKLFVRPRKEIVTLLLSDDIDPNRLSGEYLTPEKFYRMMCDEDTVILDARNDYEYDIGHFRNAISPEIKAFREYPDWIRNNLSDKKDKKILTYCTGGVRCEKLTGFLIREGFKNVFQLEGGIVTYANDPAVQGKLFDGKCYVFDERISVSINHTGQEKIVSHCHHCKELCDRYVNCANLDCHKQYFCCESCEPIHKRSCSAACKEATRHEYTVPSRKDLVE